MLRASVTVGVVSDTTGGAGITFSTLVDDDDDEGAEGAACLSVLPPESEADGAEELPLELEDFSAVVVSVSEAAAWIPDFPLDPAGDCAKPKDASVTMKKAATRIASVLMMESDLLIAFSESSLY